MPRPTNAVLTEEQENDLREYLHKRLASLRVDNGERIKADCDSWKAYENDASGRATDKNSIFSLARRATGDCQFLDAVTRRCTVYELRPNTCRLHPQVGPRPGHCPYGLLRTRGK